MKVIQGGLNRPEVMKLLAEHLHSLARITPPESMHALNLNDLRSPDITFWSAWNGNELMGCGALKELTPEHGEIKSMRTVQAHLRKGVANATMRRIIDEAARRGYRRLSLETGSTEEFLPARLMYEKYGFKRCQPFGDYREDVNSVFMTKELHKI